MEFPGWLIVRLLILLLGCSVLSACNQSETPAQPDAAAPQAQPAASDSPAQPNILVIMSDDMGIETLASFGVGAVTPQTATLDELATRGVSFSNFWAQPVCSPTRATIMTGRYSFRTGVGAPTGDNVTMGEMPQAPTVPAGVVEIPTGRDARLARLGGMGGMGGDVGVVSPLANRTTWGIRLDEFTLPEAFNEHPELNYSKAAIGKWHLSDTRNGWENHPNLIGFEHFSGLLRCCPESYFAWVQLINGEFSTRTGYAPTDKVDEAISWLDAQDDDDPWFLYLAFNTPHNPLHLPPRELLQSDYSDRSDEELRGDNRALFEAMIEAMDTEIGRLLDHIGADELENTYVVFLGDNGTTSRLVREPFRSGFAKNGVYNGGVSVPFLVTGPGVPSGQTTDALANSTDLFATLLEMAGIDMNEVVPDGVTVDSISLMPYLSNPGAESIREWIYADVFTTDLGVRSGEYAMRNARYKLLVEEGVEHFFDMNSDPYEHNDLLAGELTQEQASELAALRAELVALHATEGI